jgi:tRNA-dihydrouridine synthase B
VQNLEKAVRSVGRHITPFYCKKPVEKGDYAFRIGPVALASPFILAPLAGYTDLPFRQLCRECGAGLCYSEMISCHGLVYGQRNTTTMLASTEAERPVAMQLFGSEPEIMGEAAAILSELPIDIIDINMGCPVKKVIKKGAGAALMKNMALAEQIISRVVAATKLPVTIKIRTGWNHSSIVAEDFARMAENAGVKAVAVHARTWTDGFSGDTDWQVVAAVKKAVTIPVIGNGDIRSHGEGIARMAATGCDGVMIGRAALGNPWIFRPQPGEPSLHRRLTTLGRHLELIKQHQPAEQMLAKIKNHAGKYFKSIPQGTGMRRRIYEARSYEALENLIRSLAEGNNPVKN